SPKPTCSVTRWQLPASSPSTPGTACYRPTRTSTPATASEGTSVTAFLSTWTRSDVSVPAPCTGAASDPLPGSVCSLTKTCPPKHVQSTTCPSASESSSTTDHGFTTWRRRRPRLCQVPIVLSPPGEDWK